MTAAGTAGYGDELSAYGDLSQLGAVVVKSLASFEWLGNPAPRVAPAGEAMINAVGLSGPGVTAWRRDSLPALLARRATVVASIWGRSAAEFGAAAELLVGAEVAAVEVNASCPNLEDRAALFAHSVRATAEVVDAARVCGKPLWVKLSPNTPDIVAVAAAAVEAGAEAVTLTNTVLGLDIDIETGRPTLGNGGGGLSGGPILPIALRAVYDVRAALGELPIVGVGGVVNGRDALAMIMAGANAVQVGTASFATPRAPWKVQSDMRRWMARHGVVALSDIRGRSHG
jgi:dihydroorotate dehydrogenase (NAD+) catalytic subunit